MVWVWLHAGGACDECAYRASKQWRRRLKAYTYTGLHTGHTAYRCRCRNLHFIPPYASSECVCLRVCVQVCLRFGWVLAWRICILYIAYIYYIWSTCARAFVLCLERKRGMWSGRFVRWFRVRLRCSLLCWDILLLGWDIALLGWDIALGWILVFFLKSRMIRERERHQSDWETDRASCLNSFSLHISLPWSQIKRPCLEF
jgi:hypothetical protein